MKKKIAKRLKCGRCGNWSNDREVAHCPFCRRDPHNTPIRIPHLVKRYPDAKGRSDPGEDDEEFGLLPPQQCTINMKAGDHGCTKCQGFVSRQDDTYGHYMWCSNCGRSQEVLE